MSQMISFHIDETLIQGKITHYDPYDISVEILKPFSGLTAGCHIPYFARQFKDYRGEKGHQKAVELLTELYSALVIVKKKQAQLRSEMNKTGGLRDTTQQIKSMQVKLSEQKGKLRHRFKKKEISQKEYQVQFKQLRKQCFELDETIKNAQSVFFEKHISSVQSVLMQGRLVRFLTKV